MHFIEFLSISNPAFIAIVLLWGVMAGAAINYCLCMAKLRRKEKMKTVYVGCNNCEKRGEMGLADYP